MQHQRRALLLLIPALLLAAAALFFALRPTPRTCFVRYTVLAEVSPYVAEALAVGDALLDGRGKAAAGEILDMTVLPAETENEKGVYPDDTRRTLLLTLGAEAEAAKEGYRLGTTPLVAGVRLYLHGRASFSALCLSVEEAVPW